MFFFKQKTAYEMRISDWSSDVCSSDLGLSAGREVLMRTIVITGASRGLGLASAAHFYRQGWRVVGAMRSVEAGLEKIRAEVGASKGDPRLVGVKLDQIGRAHV